MALVSRLAALCALALARAGEPCRGRSAGHLDAGHELLRSGLEHRRGEPRPRPATASSTCSGRRARQAVFNTRVSADAQNVLGTSTVFVYGGSVEQLRACCCRGPGGSLRAFFTGLFADDQNHDGGMSTATSTDGVSWTVKPTLASEADGAQRGIARSTPRQASAAPCSRTAPRCRSGATRHRAASGYHVGHEPGRRPTCASAAPPRARSVPEAATDSATGAGDDRVERHRHGQRMVAPVQARPEPVVPARGRGVSARERGGRPQHPVGMTGRSGAAGRDLRCVSARYEPILDASPAVWRVGTDSAATLSNADGEAATPGVTAGPGRPAVGVLDGGRRRRSTRGAAIPKRLRGAPTRRSTRPVAPQRCGACTAKAAPSPAARSTSSALVTANGGTANYQQRVLPGITSQEEGLERQEGREGQGPLHDVSTPATRSTRRSSSARRARRPATTARSRSKIKRKQKTRKVKATRHRRLLRPVRPAQGKGQEAPATDV